MAAFELPRCLPKAAFCQTPHFTILGGDGSEFASHAIGVCLRTPEHTSGRFCLGLSHNPSTRMTNGLLLGPLPENYQSPLKVDECWRIVTRLKQSANLAGHPMLLPVLLAYIGTELSEVWTGECDRRMVTVNLEERIGQHPYSGRPGVNGLALDFGRTTLDLNANSSQAGLLVLRLESHLLLCRGIQEGINSLNPPGKAESGRGLVDASQILKQHTEYTRTLNESLLIQVRHIQARSQSQIAVVYNFVAQRDSRINIDIARASRMIASESTADSSSMKTIAIMTMFFLPGTFVASFFAMPLFDWAAGTGSAILGDRFWIYWAVTIPFTVVVFVVWNLWTNWRERRGQVKEDDVWLEAAPPAGGKKAE